MHLQLSLDQEVRVTEADRHCLHEFDLRQFKSTTDDWQAAFRQAVWKRTAGSNHPIFVGLSSGYDSGALHLALESQAPAHSANYFTVAAEELPDVIHERLTFNESMARAFQITLSLQDFHLETSWLLAQSEPSKYGPSNWAGGSVQEDGAAVGLSAIFRICRKAGVLVYISGAGADEIISDYGFAGRKFFPHSSFGGLFPEEMSAFFPWTSFFLGTQLDYLTKEEVVGGSHGLETRYPFLDRRVVQEFIWLAPSVKNELYKRPVHDLLTAAHYPFDAGHKDGFAAGRNLKLFGQSSVAVLYDSIPSGKVLSRDSREVSDHSCVNGRQSPWQQARSQLASFLATDDKDIVEHLASSLVVRFGELQGEADVTPCLLGEICLRLLMLLLSESIREKYLVEDANEMLVILDVPWSSIASSGWPLFELLQRLSRHAAPSTPNSNTSVNTLDAVVLALSLTTTSATVNLDEIQKHVTDFWRDSRSFQQILQSAQMSEIFTAMVRLSRPSYRVNLADAWHLIDVSGE